MRNITKVTSELRKLASPGHTLSDDALAWLTQWSQSAPRDLPPDHIIKELQKFNPTNPVRLYRSVIDPATEYQKKILAWMIDFEYSLDVFFEGDSMYRIAEVSPDQIISFNPNIFANMDPLDVVKNFDIFKEEVITFQL